MKRKSFVGKSLLTALLLIFLAVVFTPLGAEAKTVSGSSEIAAAGSTVVQKAEAADLDAEEEEEVKKDDNTGAKAIAAAIAIGIAAAGGAIGMGLAIAKANEGISRQPEADGKIRTNLMLGLVFIETAIIYALVVTILIIFVM